jgi:glycosyltransferase involved in cell wall biosynthesis
LQLVGSQSCNGESLSAIATRYGVEHLVHVRGEVDHRTALQIMKGSDIQLLVGFNGAGADLQIPAKLFEYLGVGKPVLALVPRGSAIADVMEKSGISGAICDPDNPQEISEALRRLADTIAGESTEDAAYSDRVAQFTRRAQVKRIASLLEAQLSA